MVIPELVLEGALGAFVLRHFVLHGRQGLPEIGVTWLWLYGIHRVSHLRCRCSWRYTHLPRFIAPDLPQPPVAAAPGAIHPITDRILLGVILVVLLGRIEGAGSEDLGRHVAVEAVDDLLARRAGSPALLGTTHKDRSVVIRPGVARLPVRLERIDVVPEGPEQRFVADLGWIVDHLH